MPENGISSHFNTVYQSDIKCTLLYYWFLNMVEFLEVGDIIYVAGQIALVPGTMQLVDGGVRKQCQLALRHVGRIVKAMDPNTQLRDVVQVCLIVKVQCCYTLLLLMISTQECIFIFTYNSPCIVYINNYSCILCNWLHVLVYLGCGCHH
jgi:hypothetical protein